jgi:hypothetical protein
MKKPIGVAVFAACVLGILSCQDEPTTPKTYTVFTASLTSAAEVPLPATATTATGTVIATLNEKDQLTYNVHWMGLTGNATASHIHGPADEVTAAAVIVNFQTLAATPQVPAGATPAGAGNPAFTASAASGGASGTIKLDSTVTYSAGVRGDSLKKLLLAGLLYVNVHTAANGGGEIRAQLKQ